MLLQPLCVQTISRCARYEYLRLFLLVHDFVPAGLTVLFIVPATLLGDFIYFEVTAPKCTVSAPAGPSASKLCASLPSAVNPLHPVPEFGLPSGLQSFSPALTTVAGS